MKNRIAFIVIGLLVGVTSVSPKATAQGFSFIRDAEIESTIHSMSRPLLIEAGLQPSAVNIHLVQDNALNAFVAGGQNIFLFTGLILATQNANQLLGVMAHEIGHIAGGHLVRFREAQRGATAGSLMGLVLGAAAMIGGRPDVGAALISGGQHIGLSSVLAFSRTQEASADQAAIRLLERSGISSRGMVEFLQVLVGQDLLSASRQDPYIQTHPLTQSRIDLLNQKVRQARYRDADLSPKLTTAYERVKAKLYGFIREPHQTFQRYPKSNQSTPARYARVVAYYREAQLPRAIEELDSLLREAPDNPYFHELKGQILFESGNAVSARAPLERAIELAPGTPLIEVLLARVLLAQEHPELDRIAIEHLRSALFKDRRYAFAWRQIGIAYGRTRQMGLSSLSLAEEAILLGRRPTALNLARRAQKFYPRGTPEWIRAEDIVNAADNGR